MIDVRALIGDIPTTSITLRARAAATVNAFGETSSTSVDTTITAVVHPTNKRSRMRAPEADYTRETITVYVLDVDAFDAVRAVPAPWIVYQGRTYDVKAVEDYAVLGGVVIAEAELRDEVTA